MKKIYLVLAMCAMMSMFGFSANAKETININGSTTVLPIMQSAVESYMAANPNVVMELSGTGSGNGIKALAENATDIAMASRDIKDKEVKLAKSKGIEPNRIVVAIDALIPVVNPANPVKDLTIDQLSAIFQGKVTNWKELGGEDMPIAVMSRDTSSGTYETWADLVMKKKRVSPRALTQASNGAVVQEISKNKNAIGYIGIGYVNDSVKALSIAGVMPTAENAASRKWPLARDLYVFTKGQPTGTIGDFIAFLLDPNKGQKAVSQVGFVPVK